MTTSLLERIRPALPVAMAFWAALASDDDEALAPLLSSTWDDRPEGFAALYRADRELAPETCRVLGFASHAELLAADRIRLWFSITDRIIQVKGERGCRGLAAGARRGRRPMARRPQ